MISKEYELEKLRLGKKYAAIRILEDHGVGYFRPRGLQLKAHEAYRNADGFPLSQLRHTLIEEQLSLAFTAFEGPRLEKVPHPSLGLAGSYPESSATVSVLTSPLGASPSSTFLMNV